MTKKTKSGIGKQIGKLEEQMGEISNQISRAKKTSKAKEEAKKAAKKLKNKEADKKGLKKGGKKSKKKSKKDPLGSHITTVFFFVHMPTSERGSTLVLTLTYDPNKGKKKTFTVDSTTGTVQTEGAVTATTGFYVTVGREASATASAILAGRYSDNFEIETPNLIGPMTLSGVGVSGDICVEINVVKKSGT